MGKRAARRMTVVAVPKASAPRGSPMGQGTPRLRFGIASGEAFPLRSEIRCALFKPSPKGEVARQYAVTDEVSSDAGRIIGAAGENRGLSTASASLRSAPSRQGEGIALWRCMISSEAGLAPSGSPAAQSLSGKPGLFSSGRKTLQVPTAPWKGGAFSAPAFLPSYLNNALEELVQLPARERHGAGAAGGTPPHTAKQKAPSPNRETVLFAVQKFRFHEPLPVEGTGAVTSVRVTPLEKVRLLRMVEKSLDMLR